jgi:hypothetical protein
MRRSGFDAAARGDCDHGEHPLLADNAISELRLHSRGLCARRLCPRSREIARRTAALGTGCERRGAGVCMRVAAWLRRAESSRRCKRQQSAQQEHDNGCEKAAHYGHERYQRTSHSEVCERTLAGVTPPTQAVDRSTVTVGRPLDATYLRALRYRFRARRRSSSASVACCMRRTPILLHTASQRAKTVGSVIA